MIAYVHVQDLKGELDSHQNTYDVIQATGQHLLRAVGRSDSATLQRRLDQMNERWDRLRLRSAEIR
jgi:hypothetical protein